MLKPFACAQADLFHVCRLKLRIFLLTALAMIAFASNSLLCRLALKQTSIDAATFTFIRILSGAVALWLIIQIRKVASASCQWSAEHRLEADATSLQGNWPSALALYIYAAAFSFAYLDLSAGTGALLLFGAVQATMILWGLSQGERLRPVQMIGLVAAIAGLIVLVSPGITAPPFVASILMLGAGVAWGTYSLRGRSATDATAATTGNFLRAVPLAAAVSAATLPWVRLDYLGMIYATASGAITSGIGYVIWYKALPDLKAIGAATVQLSVPVLAAIGGILLLGESITIRFVLASAAILGGIFLVIIEKRATT